MRVQVGRASHRNLSPTHRREELSYELPGTLTSVTPRSVERSTVTLFRLLSPWELLNCNRSDSVIGLYIALTVRVAGSEVAPSRRAQQQRTRRCRSLSGPWGPTAKTEMRLYCSAALLHQTMGVYNRSSSWCCVSPDFNYHGAC